MSRRGPAHVSDLLVPLGLLGALSMVSALGFLAVFVGWTFLWAPLVAVLAAGGVAWFAARRGLLVGESVALSLVLFLVVGIVVVGGGPFPSAARTFLRALVEGWAELLTSYTPADVTPTVLALPFTLAWLGMLSGGELLRTTRVPGLAALGPLTLLGVSVLFSVDEPLLAVVQGALAVLLTLVLALVQQRQQRTTESDLTTGGSHRWRGRGIVLAALLVVAAVGLAPLVGPRLPGADANPRFDLRERLEPPFDPLRLPSPLASVKGELEDERAEDVVLRITTDTPVRYWPVAVMGAYDGRVWTVAESADVAAGQYRQVDTFFPAPGPGAVADDVEPVTARIQSVDLGGHWMPTPGWPVEMRESDLDVRHNPVTGNVVSPDVVSDGDMWTVTGLPRAVPEDDDLAGRDLATDGSAGGGTDGGGVGDGSGNAAGGATDLEAVPPVLRSLAGDLVEGLEPGWPQMAAIQDLLLEDGYYDLSPDTPPGHSYFHLGRFLEDEERIVGFEEQYAATGALLARLSGLGARVVVGYDLPEERFDERPVDVRAGDLTAWVEVRVQGLGWVPLDVTPTDESAPDEAEAVRAIEDVAIPNPPPPPPPPPEVERPEQPEVEEETEETEEPEEDDDAEAGPSLPVLLAGVAVGLPLGLLLLFALVVIGWKAARTRRRRNAPVPAERLTGAWAEFRDRCDERGLRAAATSSPREVALAVADRVPSARPTLEGLAATVDRGVFHPDPPDDDGADRAWSLSDDARGELDHGRSTWERLRARLSPAPLRRKD